MGSATPVDFSEYPKPKRERGEFGATCFLVDASGYDWPRKWPSPGPKPV